MTIWFHARSGWPTSSLAASAIGSVGTGFDEQKQKRIFGTLQKIHSAESPFRTNPALAEEVEWVKPELVARVKFANWTDGDNLRAPVFLAMRNDRDAKSCTFEAERPLPAGEAAEETSKPTKSHAAKWRAIRRTGERPQETRVTVSAPAPAAAAEKGHKATRTARSQDSGADIARQIREATTADLNLTVDGKNVHLTHLDKVYFPESGITKRDLLAHYATVANSILPFLEGRPLVLRRYPNGIAAQAFFQKEAPAGIPEWLETATIYSDERGGEMNYVMAEDRAALLYLTNLGCIDHNPWSSRADAQDMFLDCRANGLAPFSE